MRKGYDLINHTSLYITIYYAVVVLLTVYSSLSLSLFLAKLDSVFA